MRNYLVGARGRLGQALVREYANRGVTALERVTYQDWVLPGMADSVSRYFEKAIGKRQTATIIVASGLLDPKLPREDLLGVNYHLPRNVIEGACKLGIRVISIGTVMEGLLSAKNPYVQIKSMLGDYAASAAADGSLVAHAQIHTLYGIGQPSPFMFLGQVLNSVRNDSLFEMTSGRQIREYHHYADDANAIRCIEESGFSGVINLSHGKPHSLRTIAESVFHSLGRDALLRVGALPDPEDDNYDKVLQPPEILRKVEFRDSLPAIVEYMKGCYSGLTESSEREKNA